MKKLTLVLPTLALALSLTLSPQSFASFTDVPASHPNYEAINYVQSEGIVEGYPDGTYQPGKLIDRYEFTKIIVGAVYSKEEIEACKTSPFPDVPMDWFTPYVCLAQKTGIVSGYPDGTFQGTNQIKVVEAAKIIVNGFKYPVQEDAVTWYKPYILKLEELKALPTSLTGFEHLMKRGEMAEVIHSLHAKVTNKPSTTYANLELVTVPGAASQQEITAKAAIYANTIIKITSEANESHMVYLKTILSSSDGTDLLNSSDLDMKYQEALKDLNQGRLILESFPIFLGDSTLKDAYIDYFDTVIDSLSKEFKDIMDLWEKVNEPDYTPNEEDTLQAENLVQTINEKMETIVEKVSVAKKSFANKFNATLVGTNGDVSALNANAYINSLIIYQMEGTSLLNDYNVLTNDMPPPGDYEMLDKKRMEAINGIKKVSEEVSLSEGYQGDTSLRDALVVFFKAGVDVLENEHKQLIDLRIKMSNETLNEEDLNKMNQLYASMDEKLATSNEVFNTSKKSFAEKYGITIN